MCLSARCGGVEGLAPGPGTQSMPLPCDSSELFPQHCSGKFRDHMVLGSPASASLWGPQAFVLTPRRVGFIEKESIIHLSASSCRDKKTKYKLFTYKTEWFQGRKLQTWMNSIVWPSLSKASLFLSPLGLTSFSGWLYAQANLLSLSKRRKSLFLSNSNKDLRTGSVWTDLVICLVVIQLFSR